MDLKRIISAMLAAAMMLTVMPIHTLGEENTDEGSSDSIVTTVPSSEDDEETTETEESEPEETVVTEQTTAETETEEETVQIYELASITLQRTAVSDTSISISWDSIDYAAYYEIYCNGMIFASDITSASYTLNNLAGGSEYFISVNAYSAEGALVGASNEICVYTSLIVTSNTVLDRNIIVENLYINSGTLDVNGYTVTVNNDLGIGSGTLYVNGGKIYINNNLNQKWTDGRVSDGYLKMNNPNDYILVKGNYFCYSNKNHSGYLTRGILEVKGDFTQKKYLNGYNFYPTESHKVVLSGEKKQTISFESIESRFNILDVQNFSAEGIVFTTSVTIDTINRNGCNVTFANGEIPGWTLEADEIYSGNLNLSMETLDLNGKKLTVTGDLIHSGGTILVNNGVLEVQGDYRVQSLNGTSYTTSAGILNMTNEADTVKVLGDFVMQSTASHDGKLTAGTLEIGGNLTQLSGGSKYNFYTSGTHTVILNGTQSQTVNIADSNKEYSRINNLKIANTSAEGVNFVRTAYVVGNLYNTDSEVSNGINLVLAGTLADNGWNHDIWLNEDRILTADTEISGTLYLDGCTLNLDGYTLTVGKDVYLGASSSITYLNMNGGKLYVGGNFNMERTNGNHSFGYLIMTNAEDYVCVNGNFVVYTYYAYSEITEGIIEVKGDFIQKHQCIKSNFAPSGNNKVILSGEGLQTVSFAKTESGFNILEIKNYSDEGVVFSTAVTINDFIDNGCNVTFANGERSGWTLEDDEIFEGDLFLSRGTLDLNGKKLTVTGDLIHSGGTILVNNGVLEVQGDYRVQTLSGESYTTSAGILNMTHEADAVKVLGDFVMQSTASHDGKLTAGTLEIGGNLTQLSGGSKYNLYTSETHTVILNGIQSQTVNIADNDKDYSRINSLKITNTSAEDVNFAVKTYVVGKLYNTEASVINALNIYVTSTTKFPDNRWNYSIRLVENYKLENDLTIGKFLSHEGGTFDLNGHKLDIQEDYNLRKGTLYINGGQFTVAKDFNFGTSDLYSNGYLKMTNADDKIIINGDLYIRPYNNQSSYLKAGVMEIKGDITQQSANGRNKFYPSGKHKIILSGERKQTVAFESIEAGINILEIQNYSEEGVVFSTAVTINELIDNGCNVAFANGERAGWTLEDDEIFEGDLFLARGTLDLNGKKLTVKGDLIHSGGTILVNNGVLEVQGDYRSQVLNGTSYEKGAGLLNMTNEADTVRVVGDFVMQSSNSHKETLTAGTLEIGGNLTQLSGGSTYNFRLSGTHTVILNGTEGQTVSFSNSNESGTHFNNLKITNTSEDGVNFASMTYVVGKLYSTESSVTNSSYIHAVSTTSFPDNMWNYSVRFIEGLVLEDDFYIGGTAILDGGTFDLNGHTMNVGSDIIFWGGTLYINSGRLIVDNNLSFGDSVLHGSGILKMINDADYICVNGDFYIYTWQSSAGNLTAGVLEVKGDFTHRTNYHANSFSPSENHKVILSGETKQTVSFDSVESGFNTIEIQNYSDEGVVFSTAVTINDLIDNGCNITFANGECAGWTLEDDEIFEGDLFLSRGTLDLNGKKLTVTGNLIHSGGTILVNNGVLEVQGDYRVQSLNGTSHTTSAGILNMTNETDTVKVFGDFVMQSTASHDGKLTAGTLEIGGDLTQLSGGSKYNLYTSGTHTVILNGTQSQTVNIADNDKKYSRINSLKITNTSEGGVDFAEKTYIVGELYNTEAVIKNNSNICIADTTKFPDSKWNYDICFSETMTLGSDLYIVGAVIFDGGTFDLNGHKMIVGSNLNLWSTTLYINGGQIIVNGDFNFGTLDSYSNGTLKMINVSDYICVNGDFLIYAWSSGKDRLTNGILEIKGDFTQKTRYYSDNFCPNENHKVILSGNGIQKISFESDACQFNILEITKQLDTGYVFSRTPVWNTLEESAVDKEPPTAPQKLECVRSTSSSVVLKWNESSDNKSVLYYYVYRDGVFAGKTSELQYIDNGLLSHTAYEYYVTAVDIDGNESQWSNVIEAETDVDAYAPSRPENLTVSVSSDKSVLLSWTGSSDNGSIEKYNIYRNGIIIGSSDGTAYIDNTAFGGMYEYCVEAVDNDGNASRKSEVVYIDNLAPSAPILKIESINELYVKISWTGSDNTGVANYELYKDNIKIQSLNVETYLDTDINADEYHEYYVIAIDGYSNISDKSNIVSVYTGIDEEAPVIASIEAVNSINSGSAVIKATLQDNCGIKQVYFEVSEDNTNWFAAGNVIANKGTCENVNFVVNTEAHPDGKLYVRAYAEDIKGNTGSPETSPVCEFEVDNTAPEKVSSLSAGLNNGRIELKWSSVSDDTAYFRIYRKTEGTDFELIADNHRYSSYFDTDETELGETYFYTVTAVDSCGNESVFADEVSCILGDDKVSPYVISFSPERNSEIGEYPYISISCFDNYKLGKITVYLKKSGDDTETVIYESELDKYSQIAEFELDTDSLENGLYEISAVLTDHAGNVSNKYSVIYDYKKCELSAPMLTATPAGWSVELNWSMTSTERLVDYYVYRKDSAVSEYRAIASVTGTSYTDTNAEAGHKYYYKVRAWDDRDNFIDSSEIAAVPTSEDNILPIADAGADLMGIEGEAIGFDGTMSYDNHYISSYEWDFGDGNSSFEAAPKHIYSKAGVYTAKLTVMDSAGNSDSISIDVNVFDDSYSKIKIRTVSESGVRLGNVLIYCELPNVSGTDYSTDSNGFCTLIAPKGSYTAYFYKNGFSPLEEELVFGEKSELTVTIKDNEFITGEWEVKALDLDAIAELGIDVTAPENQMVYSYSVDVRGNGKISFIVNNEGNLFDLEKTEFIYNDYRTKIQAKPVAGSGNRGGSSIRRVNGGSGDGGSSKKFSAPMVAIFSVTTQLSWLKEFFDVELTVTNSADEEFYLENAIASLTLPDGLSLAKTSTNNNTEKNMGTINGNEGNETASWIVRGDIPGTYDNVTAEFNALLMPFNEPVTIIFENKDAPIKIHGGEGLELIVYANEYDTYWSMIFEFTNNSDRPLYNVWAYFGGHIDVGEISEMILYYSNGTIETILWKDGKPDFSTSKSYRSAFGENDEDLSSHTLEVGDTLVGMYSVKKVKQ